MEYWFPDKKRISKINDFLDGRRKNWSTESADWDEIIRKCSNTLSRAASLSGFPEDQTRKWVWLASQLRIRGRSEPAVREAIGPAIDFLKMAVKSEDRRPMSRQDFQWVISTATEQLLNCAENTDLRSLLSSEELVRIDSFIRQLNPAPLGSVEPYRKSVANSVSVIESFSGKNFISSISAKIEFLFNSYEQLSEENRTTALKALAYLNEDDDVIPDNFGILGLVDDVYVIEWAFSKIRKETLWLPLMEEVSIKWPLLSQVVFKSDEDTFSPDRYTRHFLCNLLVLAQENDPKPATLVVNEAGPLAFIAATTLAMEVYSSGNSALGKSPSEFQEGEDLVFVDEKSALNVKFARRVDYEGETHHMVWVGNDDKKGMRAIPGEIMRLAVRASRPHERLCNELELSDWIKSYAPNPMRWIASRRSDELSRTGVLLVTQRKKIESFIEEILPFGQKVSATIGVRYWTNTGREEDLGQSKTQDPLVCCCSDPDTALTLILEPPNHISQWIVVCDGARFGLTISKNLASESEGSIYSMLVVAEASDRKNISELNRSGGQCLLVTYSDVEVPLGREEIREVGARSRTLEWLDRQKKERIPVRRTQTIRSEFYEQYFDVLRQLREEAEDEDTDFQVALFSASTLLRTVLWMPCEDRPGFSDVVAKMASRVRNITSTLRMYSEPASSLYDLLGGIHSGFPQVGRMAAIKEVLSAFRDTDSGKIAVLCNSTRIAQECREYVAHDAEFDGVAWLTLDEIDSIFDIVHLIVPGWIDQKTMQKAMQVAYSDTVDFILLPFEKGWMERVERGSDSFKASLRRKTLQTYQKSRRVHDSINRLRDVLWLEPTEELNREVELVAGENSGPDDALEDSGFGFLQTRTMREIAVGALPRAHDGDEAEGTLVLFDDGDSFAIFPEHGRVIELSEIEEMQAACATKNFDEITISRPVRNLAPGMLLAMQKDRDEGFIDRQANRFIDNPERVRATANAWRQALQNYVRRPENTFEKLVQGLERLGVKRHPFTVRNWLNHESTIAPRTPRRIIPAIAEVVGPSFFPTPTNDVLEAVDLVYRARQKALATLARQIFMSGVDLGSKDISIVVDGAGIDYELCRIRELGGNVRASRYEMGMIQRISVLKGR